MGNEITTINPTEWAVATTGMTKEELYEAVKVQCFGGVSDKIKPFHITTYFSMAKNLGLNPLMPGSMYGFPTKSGQLQIILGPDGLYSVLRNNDDVKYWRTTPNYDKAGNLVSATAKIYTKTCDDPFEYTALLSEWRMPSSPVWQQKPIHMLEYRALKQCARYVVGNGLLPDREEAKMADMYEVDTEVVSHDSPAIGTHDRLKFAVASAPLVARTVFEPKPRKMSDVTPPTVPQETQPTATEPAPEAEPEPEPVVETPPNEPAQTEKSRACAMWTEAKKLYPELFESLSIAGRLGKDAMSTTWLKAAKNNSDVSDCVSFMLSDVSEQAALHLDLTCPPDVYKEVRQRIDASSDKKLATILEAIGGGW